MSLPLDATVEVMADCAASLTNAVVATAFAEFGAPCRLLRMGPCALQTLAHLLVARSRLQLLHWMLSSTNFTWSWGRQQARPCHCFWSLHSFQIQASSCQPRARGHRQCSRRFSLCSPIAATLTVSASRSALSCAHAMIQNQTASSFTFGSPGSHPHKAESYSIECLKLNINST